MGLLGTQKEGILLGVKLNRNNLFTVRFKLKIKDIMTCSKYSFESLMNIKLGKEKIFI